MDKGCVEFYSRTMGCFEVFKFGLTEKGTESRVKYCLIRSAETEHA